MPTTPTAGGIPFRVVLGHSAAIVENITTPLQSVRNPDGSLHHMESSDPAWIQRMVEAGHIQRLDAVVNNGIQKITIVEGALPSDPIEYKLEIEYGGETGIIRLEEGEIFSFMMFRQNFLAFFQVLLPKMKADEWEEIIRPLIENAERVQDDSDEAPAVLDVINYIESAQVVKEKKDLVVGGGHTIWHDESQNIFYVQSGELAAYAEKYNITRKRLGQLVARYRIGNAIQERIAGKKFSLWGFCPERFDRTEENTHE